LQCNAADTENCLTGEEVKTAQLIYQGPRNPRTGEEIYPGFVRGSEASPEFTGPMAAAYSWSLIQGPLAKQYAVPLLKNLAFGEDWDWRTFDFDKDAAKFDAAVHDKIDAIDPDLQAFQVRGGKLIMVQGWGDPFNAQTLPIEYRDKVIAAFGAKAGKAAARKTVDGFFRLFMAPGMSHCMGGPGPSKFDALAALREWVENRKAPERLVARKTSFVPSASDVPMSRPLCPYPQEARWSGKGSTRDAANFSCAAPKPDGRR
jgi:feruloyl esterase